MPEENSKLPVIIAGAGPCGLVAAITLQQEGVPFLLLERASRERLCSNVGSGFDIAPTALDILRNRLKIADFEGDGFKSYAGMYMCDMDGREVRECPMTDMVTGNGKPLDFLSVNRAAMQERFLGHLLRMARANKSDFEESEILKCSVEVVGYEDSDEDDRVAVKLNDGSTVNGSALLACDGIHSAVRRSMVESLPSKPKDELHDCKIVCWWGKMDEYKEGSDFDKALQATQKRKELGSSFLWALGDHARPGSFMAAPADNTFMWAFFMRAHDLPPKLSDDLTRRGGCKLDEDAKQSLEKMVNDRGDLIRLAISDTPVSGITKVGLFDRENLHLPYARGRVALLGDSAHPQTPFMGQGVNQAIVDAYVCSTRLARQPVAKALQDYDSKARRQGVNGVIEKARSYGDMSVSKSWIVCWLFYAVARWMPLSWIWADMVDGDVPNHDFVAQLDKDLLA